MPSRLTMMRLCRQGGFVRQQFVETGRGKFSACDSANSVDLTLSLEKLEQPDLRVHWLLNLQVLKSVLKGMHAIWFHRWLTLILSLIGKLKLSLLLFGLFYVSILCGVSSVFRERAISSLVSLQAGECLRITRKLVLCLIFLPIL
ncbi:hypothetical protein CJ030_MR7G022905 [Morella rubra]|uniref:Uncharacterized protein n=1 Tax=Morella rubra TaxID=262757 RepID=A0A6A1V4E7_9ROSI|nr:hypothetical protein CJ030_MR7G022905 [Morella rubra]